MSIASATQETTESLIKPANVQEQLLAKVAKLREENLKAEEEYRIKNAEAMKEELIETFYKIYRKQFIACFGNLSKSYFGVKKEQILGMSDPEIETLFLLVLKQATRTNFRWKIFCWCVPIVGWILAPTIFDSDSKTHGLVSSTRELKKALGDNFNPVKIIRDKEIYLDWL